MDAQIQVKVLQTETQMLDKLMAISHQSVNQNTKTSVQTNDESWIPISSILRVILERWQSPR